MICFEWLEGAESAYNIEILKGQRGITADTALRLGQWLGTGPELWLNLQKSYELRLAQQEVGEEIQKTVERCLLPQKSQVA